MAQAISVVINGTSKPLKDALKDAEKQIVDFYKQQGAVVGQGGKAYKKTHDDMIKVGRDFMREQNSQGRMARFYAGELASVIPVGKETQATFQGLTGILIEGAAGGLTWGLAFEATKFIIGEVTSAITKGTEEAKKFHSEMMKFYADNRSAVQQLTDDADLLRRQLAGATPEQAKHAQEVEKVTKEYRSWADSISILKDELAKIKTDRTYVSPLGPKSELERALTESIGKSEEFAKKLAAINIKYSLEVTQKEKKEEQDWAIERLRIRARVAQGLKRLELDHQANIKEINREGGANVAEKLALEEERYLNERYKLHEKHWSDVSKLSAEYLKLTGQAQEAQALELSNLQSEILEKYGVQVLKVETQRFLVESDILSLTNGELEAAAKKLGIKKEELQALQRELALRLSMRDIQNIQEKFKGTDQLSEATGQDMRWTPGEVIERDNATGKKLRDAERLRKELDQAAQAGQALASTFSDLGTAIGGTAGSMAQMFGKLIQQAIQLAIAMSATGSPYAWLNIAASAAAILATVASVPEFRAAGGPVSYGAPYIVGERGPELFVPGSDGAIVPNGGFGGNTFIIHANDAKSFDRMVRDNPETFIRLAEDMRRSRR